VEGMRRQVEGALDRVDAAEKRVGKVAHRLETRPPPGGGGRDDCRGGGDSEWSGARVPIG